MGRKRKRIVRTRPIPTLPTVFNCPLCGTTNSIQIQINRKDRIALISCQRCKTNATRSVRPIEERVDVYGDWLDELYSSDGGKTG